MQSHLQSWNLKGPTPSHVFSHTEKVVANSLASLYSFPTEARDKDNAHNLHSSTCAPVFLCYEPSLKLICVDILFPVMGSSRNQSYHILCDQLRGQPTRPSTSDRTDDQPPTRLHEGHAGLKDLGRIVDVLKDLEKRNNIEFFGCGGRDRQFFDGLIFIRQTSDLGQERIKLSMLFSYFNAVIARVDSNNSASVAQPSCAFGKYSSSTSDIEISLLFCD